MNDTKERINKMLKKSEVILNAGKPHEMTNEEWIKSANTEQLAEWIAHQTMIALLENQNNHSLRMTYPAYWVEWLKQPHTPIS